MQYSIVAHLGQTISTGFRAIYYDGDVSLRLGIAELWGSQDSATALVRDDMVGLTLQFSQIGSLLVRPIPEPSTALLLVTGLAGLAAVGRRRS